MHIIKLSLICLFLSQPRALATAVEIPLRSGYGIDVAAPAEVHFDEAELAKAFAEAAQLDYSHSLLVLRDNKLVGEGYFHGYSAASPNNLHSVSKSILSALVGIALDKKFLTSPDQKLRDFFPDIFKKINESSKDELTLAHLLTMSAGLDVGDESPSNDGWAQLDRTENVLRKKLLTAPGEKYSYSTQYSHVISRILTVATKTPTREFAEKYLFKPLGVKVMGWPRDALGYYLGDMIFLTSRDMAKFGLLFLNDGLYRGRRILSPAWVKTSTSGKIAGSEGNGEYGFHWWSKPDAKVPYFYAWGFGGQYIVVAPSKQVVVVMTNDFTAKRPQEKIRALIERILAAAK